MALGVERTLHPDMASQISFVMHPEDERAFLGELIASAGWLVITGPGAASLRPLAVDTPGGGEIVYLTRANWVEAKTGAVFTSLQFWRSRLVGNVLTQGRIAGVRPSDDSAETLEAVARSAQEFRRLRAFLRRTYVNRLLVWRHENEREDSPAVPADKRTWVGPAARAWLAADPTRCVQQVVGSRVSGWLVPADA